MCGIFGVICKPNRFHFSEVENALDKLSHRGPNDKGLEKYSMSNKWDIWFGQTRLSIIDLSQSAHQPMERKIDNQKKSLIFNGEIYNFKELKKEFKDSWEFNSTSDTEVLLAGLSLEGSAFFKKINGMLACAYYNESEQKITLARDRIGKKPLYIYSSKDLIIFASELKSIVSLSVPLTLNHEGLAYFRYMGYIPAHLTIYNECLKLKAASYIELDLSKDHLHLNEPTLYWDPLVGYSKSYKNSYDDAVDQFLELLDDATRIRLTSDVPVGAFLSGGIDSSLVVSSLKKLNTKDIRAFTVKYDDKTFDESDVAKETAMLLDFPLEILHLTEKDYANQYQKISYHYDEPFSDSSQIPTLAISEAAKKHVSVVLTGDGGDEVFLGYPRFSFVNKLSSINRVGKIIPFSLPLVQFFLNTNLGHILFKFLLKTISLNANQIDSKIERLVQTLKCKNLEELYDSILCTNQKSKLAKSDIQSLSVHQNYYNSVVHWNPNYSWDALKDRSNAEKFAALDLVSYMRDDVLVKVDRGTMAYSLEARSPLLDYRIVEFGTSLPHQYKSKNGIHKKILRDALARRIKSNVVSLPKKGFGVPLPKHLPEGANLISRWNIFVENEWKKQNIGVGG